MSNAERVARYKSRNPDKVGAAQRKHARKKYGVKDPTSERRVGPCEICGVHCDPLHLDHDHTTGEVRGWLCGPCNRVLGSVKDNPERLRAMAAYLEKSACLIN